VIKWKWAQRQDGTDLLVGPGALPDIHVLLDQDVSNLLDGRLPSAPASEKPPTISSFLALSAKLLLPKFLFVFFNISNALSTHSMSFNLNSVEMICISLNGSTSPSTWMTSASSKARTTWKIPSTARTCDKKAFPRPAPVEAPAVRPAISIQVRNAGISVLGL
jgi:hypothetical protein